jgi:hypothetical protein
MHNLFLYIPLFVCLDSFGYLPNKHEEVFLTWQRPYPHLFYPRNSLCLYLSTITSPNYNSRNASLNKTIHKSIPHFIISVNAIIGSIFRSDLNFRLYDSRTNRSENYDSKKLSFTFEAILFIFGI